MKAFKGFVGVVLLVCSFFACLSVSAAAEDVVVSLQIGNPIMQVNGVDVEIDPGRNTKPVIVNGRTLVPIRAIVEAFGGAVAWVQKTQSVLLDMEDDRIRLDIDSNVAYFNQKKHELDVAPTIINDRTMIPIRFVAEKFNLGVAWDEKNSTVSIIRNTFDDEEYDYLTGIIPKYSGVANVKINGNRPFFADYEIIEGSFEFYGNLDELGRCDVCFASVAEDIMPEESRGSISSVTPTGWKSITYDNIDGSYLYNRCHLIGHQLTGENSNKRNLITGTRYLNVEGMLPFENAVFEYIKATGNRVIFRSTPVFSGDNLVADGVLLEAYSVEDEGTGICFCVFCYNVQPGIEIDYATGESSFVGFAFEFFRTPSGKRYHRDPKCGGENSYGVMLEDAVNAGLTPCRKCAE